MDRNEIRRVAEFTFADQQSNGESWYRSAVSFHEGALVLGPHIDSIHGGMRVFLLNFALSIELLLKAIIVAKGGLASYSHNLHKLANAAGIAFTKDQEATLELLGEILRWSGRYPVPTKQEAWDHYYDHVFERHVIREREGNTGRVRANPMTFPSVKNCEAIWSLANLEWNKINPPQDGD